MPLHRLAARAFFLALAALLLTAGLAAAQGTGAIAGTVIDADFGDPLTGANVVIVGTTTGSSTDLDGKYRIPNLEPGTYDIQARFIGFEPVTITGIVVRAGKDTPIDITLGFDSVELNEVIVTAEAIRSGEGALLRDRQKASGVSDAISAEAISRSGAGDAAGAMSKVTGASVVDGKYVYVRGLGDRYSSTTLNGSALPSSDPDRKAFQLDLFPAGLIENIVTLKTFTPDKPGDFTGGLVNVATKTFPSQLTFSLGMSASYDSRASFNDEFLTYEGGSRDWLGIDDGARELPGEVSGFEGSIPGQGSQGLPNSPETSLQNTVAVQDMQRLVGSFSDVMTTSTETAPLNHGISLSIGGPSTFAGGQVGYTASLSYGRSFQIYDDATFGDWRFSPGSSGLVPQGAFYSNDLTTYTDANIDIDPNDAGFYNNLQSRDEVNWGSSVTLSYRPVPNHEISGTFLRTQSGAQQSAIFGGVTGQSTLRASNQQVLRYVERSLSTYQLRGESNVRRSTIEWNTSYGRSTQDEPDFRLTAYAVNGVADPVSGAIVDTTYALPGAQGQEPTRFFRDLVDQSYNGGADFTIPFKQWSGGASKFKVGGTYSYKDRRFDQRRFLYQEGNLAGISPVDFRLYDGDLNGYFAQQGSFEELNLGNGIDSVYAFGLYLQERSAPVDNYDADETVGAGYAMIDMPLTSWLRFIGGARAEYTDIDLISDQAFYNNIAPGVPGQVLEPDSAFTAVDSAYIVPFDAVLDILPSLNLVAAIGERMNVRAAATRTLARPTFRELAPYSSFDFVGGRIFFGAPLDRTLVTNLDLRWDWFLRPGELIAISTYYKYFTDPIERFIVPNTGGEVSFESVTNVPNAELYGAEFEVRKALDNVTGLPVLRRLQLSGNLTLVQSTVDIPEDELKGNRFFDPDAPSTRPLQGMSPYIVNLSASYVHPGWGSDVSLFFNMFGERLLVVGQEGTPDIYEQPRPDLDLTAAQRLGNSGVNLKMGIRNILGTDYEESQEFEGQTFIARSYSRARTVSFGVSYGF